MSVSPLACQSLRPAYKRIPIANRWWVYQRERFPVLIHGPMIAVFGLSAISFSSILRGDIRLPDAQTVLVTFLTAFLFFLQLRIADEWKDYQEDVRFRPYRPVPRGIVTLQELRKISLLSALLQLALAFWLSTALIPLLLMVWGYMGLMTKEFFVSKWLKAHPLAYLASHQPIIALICLYATASDWAPTGGAIQEGIFWFVLAGFFNGTVFEIGRKIRAPQDEELGVGTYSVLWGREKAVFTWLGAVFLSAVATWMAAYQIYSTTVVFLLLGPALVTTVAIVIRFLRQPVTARAKAIERASGAWTLIRYLSLGPIPLLFLLKGV